MKKVFYIILPFLLLSCGINSNNNSSSSSESEDKSAYLADIAVEGYSNGYGHGAKDGWNDSYKSSYKLSIEYLFDEEKMNSYKTGYSKGYNEGYNAGKAAYQEELTKRREATRPVLDEYGNRIVRVTSSSTPNVYSTQNYSSTPNISSGSIYSNESIYDKYPNYRETSNCVDGVVVYEGDDDFYIVETRRGFTVLEVYSGILYEGNQVRGELNRYGFKYLINKRRDSEVKVYIEEYMLSKNKALEWLGEHDHLDSADQRAYDAYNE